MLNDMRVHVRGLAAYDRWGCDMFYVDSTSFDLFPPFTSVKLMPGSIWEKVHKALPHILFIPETTSFDSVPYTAPLRNDWSHAAQGSGAAMVRTAQVAQLAPRTPG